MGYTFTDQIYAIVDPTLGIKVRQETPQTEAKRTHYAYGALRSVCHYQNDHLHGPSRFFAENGYLLSETWFWEGKKLGTARLYYASGALYALMRYRDGKKTGRHDYFYENGRPKTRTQFQDDVLHRETQLFWPESQKKRRCYFEKGQRCGLDQIWNEAEQSLSEIIHDA